MDQNELKQNIKKYYLKLPDNLQKLFSEMKWMSILQNASIKYKLTDEQSKTLATETTLLLLAVIEPEEYKITIENELGLDKIIFNELLNEINMYILNDNYGKLLDTYLNNNKELLEEKYGGEMKLDDRFNSLPKEVQESISESNYQGVLYDIAEKHKLNVAQMGELEDITIKVMLGIIHPDQYETELASKIKIDEDELTGLVDDVNEKILGKIREILKTHWGKENESKNTKNDEIPLPPYKETIKNETSGIIEKPEQTKPLQEAVKIPIPSYAKSTTSEIVEEKNTLQNIIEEKLKGVTTSEHTISDHSLPKISSMSDIKKNDARQSSSKADPYRESFE